MISIILDSIYRYLLIYLSINLSNLIQSKLSQSNLILSIYLYFLDFIYLSIHPSTYIYIYLYTQYTIHINVPFSLSRGMLRHRPPAVVSADHLGGANWEDAAALDARITRGETEKMGV